MSPNAFGDESDGAPLRESTDQIRRLTRRLIEGQEAERARLAREAVRDLYGQVQALARDVRRTSHGLHPARLELLGLIPALRGLCSDLSAAHGLAIAVDASGVPENTEEAPELTP